MKEISGSAKETNGSAKKTSGSVKETSGSKKETSDSEKETMQWQSEREEWHPRNDQLQRDNDQFPREKATFLEEIRKVKDQLKELMVPTQDKRTSESVALRGRSHYEPGSVDAAPSASSLAIGNTSGVASCENLPDVDDGQLDVEGGSNAEDN